MICQSCGCEIFVDRSLCGGCYQQMLIKKIGHRTPPKQVGSYAPTVPNNDRLVIIEELGGRLTHVGWFDSVTGWWYCLSDERLDGRKMGRGEWCSLSIRNITGWREIHQPTKTNGQGTVTTTD